MKLVNGQRPLALSIGDAFFAGAAGPARQWAWLYRSENLRVPVPPAGYGGLGRIWVVWRYGPRQSNRLRALQFRICSLTDSRSATCTSTPTGWPLIARDDPAVAAPEFLKAVNLELKLLLPKHAGLKPC